MHRLRWPRGQPKSSPAEAGPSISGLSVGATGLVEGIYHVHWEWPRLAVRGPGRRWWPGARTTLCEVLPGEVPVPAVIARARASAGRGPGMRFAVVIDATVVEHGSFGHRGTLRWRLSPREWIAVERLP